MSVKKLLVHMNATNDHMFAGVDPHQFCVILLLESKDAKHIAFIIG